MEMSRKSSASRKVEPISGWMRHLCIFANPSQAGALGQFFFEDGGRIGEAAPLDGLARLPGDPIRESFQPRGKDVVVIG